MAHIFERQESVNEVNDEDLFGGGRDKSPNEGDIIEKHEVNFRATSDDASPIDGNILPNFGLLGLSVSSDEDEKKRDSDASEKRASNKKNDNDDNFKGRYRSKGSISSIEEKRKQFRDRLDIEVFENDILYEDTKPNRDHVRKSNSLPDVILSSSSHSSPSPSTKVHSDSSSFDPDVTQPFINCANNGDGGLKDKKSKKVAFEGQSSSKADLQKIGQQKSGGILMEQEDEGFSNEKKDEANDKPEPNDLPEGQDAHVGRKRELYSRSSGYQTGSESNSRSKGSMQSQTSTIACSEASSEPWISNEIPNENHEENDDHFGNIPNMSGFSFTASMGNSCNEESGSSRTTIISAENRTTQCSSENKDKPNDVHETLTKDSSLTFSRLKTESYTEDENVLEKGNVPNLDVFDSSVCVGPSTINQINKEDNENFIRQTEQRFNNGSLQAGSLMPSSGSRSSCTDSITVKRVHNDILEELMKKGEDPSVILRYFQNSDSSTPSPSPAELCKVISPGQKFTCNSLLRASRCQMEGCTDKACKQLAFINMALEKEILPVDYDHEMVKQYGHALWEHHNECEELWCKVRYCQQIGAWDVAENDVDGIIDCIQRKLREPIMNVVVSDTYMFHKIRDKDHSLHSDDLQSYIPLSSIGKFGSTLLCLDKSRHMCVVKEYAIFDYHHQASLYNRLCEKHPYIVDQMWILEHETLLQICSDFMPGGSLSDYMRRAGHLTWNATMTYVLQMLSALTFLHKNRIVYLNWHGENMLFSDTSYQRIKMTNFSLSIPLDVKYDLGSVKQCLSPNIIPPELVQENGNVELKSDIWGVGCQMYELLTGNQVWNNYRHESPEYMHKRICHKVPLAPTTLAPHQKNVFTACWQINPQDRYTTERLYDFITINSQNQ